MRDRNLAKNKERERFLASQSTLGTAISNKSVDNPAFQNTPKTSIQDLQYAGSNSSKQPRIVYAEPSTVQTSPRKRLGQHPNGDVAPITGYGQVTHYTSYPPPSYHSQESIVSNPDAIKIYPARHNGITRQPITEILYTPDGSVAQDDNQQANQPGYNPYTNTNNMSPSQTSVVAQPAAYLPRASSQSSLTQIPGRLSNAPSRTSLANSTAALPGSTPAAAIPAALPISGNLSKTASQASLASQSGQNGAFMKPDTSIPSVLFPYPSPPDSPVSSRSSEFGNPAQRMAEYRTPPESRQRSIDIDPDETTV